MRKNIFILLLCLMASCWGFAQNNVIESELQTVLNQRNDDYIDINIVFKSQISSEELSSIGVTNDKSVRREKMINELKRHSQATQKDVMSVLEAEEKNGNVIDVKSYWLTNFINCKAKSDVIYQLASRSDIELISINQEIEVVSDVTSGTESRDVQSATIAQHLTQVEADKVWELGYTGKGVIVAVLDSGVNTEHEDLKDHLWNGNAQHGYNVVNPGQAPIDDRSHGTHCAGIVCGDGTSGKITGAAPDATLMSIKLYDANSGLTLSRLTAGIQFATTYGADILSISQGWSNLSASNRTTLRNTFDNLLNLDIIAVVAAGNDRQSLSTIPAPNNVCTPGDCPPPWLHPDQTTQGGLSSVVSVGAVDSDNVVSGISSQGPVTWQGTSYNDYPYNPGMGLIRPDIAAPGNSIVSLDNETNNGYAIKSGTSMATPCVAGVMALMLEKNPELKPADLCRIIETTATKISNKKNNDTGSGVINALAAVQAVNFNTSGPYFCQYLFTKNLTFGTNQSLELTLINNGQGSTSGNTNVTISTNDAYTTIVEGNKTYGTMAAGATASATFVVSVDNLVPDNHTVTFTVSATNGSYSRTFDIDVNIDNEFVAPIVNVQANGTTVNLTWNATNNATSYNVYRDGTLHGNTTSTSYTDSGLEYATLYAYTVTSKRGELESEHSLTTRIQTGDNPETPSPTNVAVNNGNITWTNATGSKGSNIYRKDYLAGSETSVATNVSGTSYTDNNWNSLKDGVYQYGVSNLYVQNETVYTQNFTDLNVTSSTGVYPTMNAYWYIYRGGSGNSYNWKIDSYITNAGKRYESFSGKAAFITSNYSNSSYLSYLVTRPMDYTQYNGKDVKLSFKYIIPAWGNDINTLKVMISTTSYNSGWTELWSSNEADVQGWPEQVVDLSAYVGQQFYIAFVNVAGYGYCTGVDEVSVYVENEVESRIEWSESVGKNVNMFVQDGNWSNTNNWSAKRLPNENENVIINADATIASGNVEVNSLTINEGKSLTLNSGTKLTVIGDFTNTDADAFIVNDGAQVIQDNEDVAATFNMNIINPQEWSANNTSGWQFITSPLKNAKIEDFIPETSEYDLYKYDGNKNIEWLNHKDENIYDDDTEPEGPQDIIVEIGADKNPEVSNNCYLPVYDYAKYSMSQQIYTAEELGENIGKIKSISFKLGNQRTSVTRQYEVYITSTELDAFNGNTFTAISASDKVFDGDVEIEGTQDSWYTINLDKPFNYQGGNIIITVYDKSGVQLSSFHYFYKYAASGRALYKQGSSSYNMSNLGTGTQQTYVNQIQIGMTIGEVTIQKDIIVETGADKNPEVGNNLYLPVYDFAKYSMSQQIYTAEELGGIIGEINSIAFKLGNQRTSVTRKYEVYITSTELNAFNGNTFTAISASDKVFDGDVEIEGTQDSWYTINLDKPFNYQGGNIIITVYDKSGVQLSSTFHYFYKYSASGRALYKQGESSYNMSNLGTGTQLSYVSQVQFGMFVTIDAAPAAPQNLYATATSSTSVSLSWNASSLSTGYNIYQGNIMIASGITGNTYTVENLSASTEYCFNVTAVNEIGESPKSTEACATTFMLAPAAPQNLVAVTNGESSISLTWDAVATASSYNVYQGLDKVASNITSTSYNVEGLAGGTEYCFSVKAVNSGGESEASDEACAETEAFTGCMVVFTLTDSYGDGWNGNYLVVSYGNVSEQLDLKSGSTITYELPIPQGTQVTLTYTKGPGQYTYPKENGFTVAYESGEVILEVKQGEVSNTKSWNIVIDCQPSVPSAPMVTAKSSNDSSITLSMSSAGASSYNIYQGTTLVAMGITENTYIVDGLEANTQYCFNVTAVNEVGESEATEACATTLEEGAAVVSIGEGTIAQMAAPVYDAAGNNYSLSQQIFTKAEIGLNSASISSISFHQAAGNNNVRNITVYMQNVDKTSFSGNYDWIAFSDSDIVYQGEFNFGTAGEWVTIEFPEAFEYTGGNIAVSVYDQTGTNFGYEYTICDKFYNSEIADWRGMYYTNENSINVSNLSSLYGTKMNTGNWGTPANVYYINNIKLAYLPSKSDVKSSQNITDINGGFVSAKNYPMYNGTELGGGSNQFESTFQQGVGYMASYESENIATFKGTLSHEKSYTFEVKYNDKKELANFHLLGNPFTFDMNWNNVNASGLASGYAVVNENGGYDYSSTGTIKVGDGFFVKAVSKDASLSYNGNLTKRSETVNEEVRFINIITSDKNGKDNVVINLTDEEQEGFPKISNLNESIANVYVPYNDRCYGVYNCNNDVKEVEVYFEAKKMGNYTISAVTEGNFESVVLLDRFTGKETNMLLNDYDFTATAQDAINRFVVRFVIAQPSTINSNFAYQSGEELVITTEGAVQILDIMGRLVYSNNVVSDNNRINISKLSKTAYIVRLINENGVNTQKVVIY